ncbi:MAG: hypothetical protein HFJ28_02540 [Clostridia bacterium]|nr:hypothetical protein [Clostridia bacterium]
MLRKLLKYDLKWIYKELIVFYLLALTFSAIGRSLGLIQNSIVFSIASGVTIGIAVGMLLGSLVNCMLRLWSRFLKSLYKDEAYLTHTLPVEKKTVYTSKVITAIITLFTTVIVILACLAICFYSQANMQMLKESLEIVETTYNIDMIAVLFLMAIIILTELVFIVLLGYVGIIIGHRANKHKILYSVITGYVGYMITQIASLLVVFLFGILNPQVMNLISTTQMLDVDIIKYMLLGATGLYIVYNIIFYIIGKKQLEKGVNVE